VLLLLLLLLQDEAGQSLPAQLDLRAELKDLKLSFDLAQVLTQRSRLQEDLAALTPHGCPGTPTQV
jgi:hypothetical protein